MKVQFITKDEQALLKKIQGLPKQQAFAQFKAVNETLVGAHKDLKAEVVKEFDRPTRFFINSTYVNFAQRKAEQVQAFIAPKDTWVTGSDSAERIYMTHVFGGQRKDKRSETLLKQSGRMPQGKNLINARYGARKDRYGNISKGMIQKILAGLRSMQDPYSNSKPGSRSKGNAERWAYTTINGVTGVWDVGGRKPKLYFYEANRAVYKPRLKYFQTIEKSVNQNFDGIHAKWLKRALQTAK